jgi:SAM-dependent methyltransferase
MNPIKDFYSSIKGRSARNSSREYLMEFVTRAAKSVPQGSLVLDAGSSEAAPYRQCFQGHRYESADFAGEPKALTYVCDLTAIPVEPERYDMVVCTQVLEHVPRPEAVLVELYRVLKPGRQLWLSTPLFYEEHMQPYDFFRYTRFGLRSLFERAGFSVNEIVELEGYYGTLSYQMDVAVRSLPIAPSQYGGGAVGMAASGVAMAIIPIFSVLGNFYARLDRRKKLDGVGHCKNYCVVATKPVL